MSNGTIVSWKTFLLFLAFPPLAILAIVLFPLTILLAYLMYTRGKRQAIEEEQRRDHPSNG
jgi:hypothetical protein